MKSSRTETATYNSTRATCQGVLDVPTNVVAEVIEGTLYTSPGPTVPHTRTSLDLFGIISSSFGFGREGLDGRWIFYEPELHLGRHIVVPDIAGWSRERLPESPTGA